MKRRFAIMMFWAAFLASVPVLTGAGRPLEGSKNQSETLTYESPVFTGSGKEYRPEPEMEREGKRYRLVSSELQRAVKTGREQFVSSWVSFSLEGNLVPPETAEIMVTDEETGMKKEYTVPMMEMKETGREWSDDFLFAVTVTGYGADSFWLGSAEIPGDVPLEQLGAELLSYLKLPEDCYRVETVAWTGEPYEREGILCRDAQAEGKKLMRKIDARYGGQVKLPPVEGMKYDCVYREITEENGEKEMEDGLKKKEEKEEEAAVSYTGNHEYEGPAASSETLAEKVFRWFTENLTVVRIGAVFLAGVLFVIFLLAFSGRKKKKGGK